MNRIIVMFKDEDKEVNMSLYDFIDEIIAVILFLANFSNI